MLNLRRNARCTAVADSLLLNSRMQEILCCIVAISLTTDAVLECSSGSIRNFTTFSFKYTLQNSNATYSSGNIASRYCVHLSESICTSAASTHFQDQYFSPFGLSVYVCCLATKPLHQGLKAVRPAIGPVERGEKEIGWLDLDLSTSHLCRLLKFQELRCQQQYL
jgi:hypothetical protein